MSLLLDALKKAADDKQKAAQARSPELDSSASAPANSAQAGKEKIEAEASGKTQPSTEELSLQASENSQNIPQALLENGSEGSAELTLDIVGPDIENRGINEARADTSKVDDLTLDGTESGHNSDLANSGLEDSGSENKAANELSLDKKSDDNASARDQFTVSDEVLSMLIYKTNRNVKKDKKILFAGVSIASLAILVSGGVYYYLDTQTEIDALEDRHRVAMQAMQVKTSRKKTPKNSEIIRNLASESDLDKKVQYAKQHISGEKNSRQVQPQVQPQMQLGENTKTDNRRYINTATTVLSIKKTKKTDPVAEKLDAAWLLYESGQYDEAKNLYQHVLTMEENNRDALLGLAAIAVIEKNASMARGIYLSLLKQDPRDPIAIAALASLHGDELSLKSDEEYLLAMLQKNPHISPLNFALGNVYAQQNKWKSAQRAYFNAWQQNNENADYIFNLAVSMDQLGKQQQALDFYKDSLLASVNKQVSFSREAVQKRINELSEL